LQPRAKNTPDGRNPGQMAWKMLQRPFIMMEHGVGLTPSKHPGYAGGLGGIRNAINLFLVPNQHTYDKNAKANPNGRQVVIGTPKLDKWADYKPQKHTGKPIVAIVFHWNGAVIAPEAGYAYPHCKDALIQLAEQGDFHLVAHMHPKSVSEFRPIYKDLGIEIIERFEDVMDLADEPEYEAVVPFAFSR
jgi:hypothetical protein